MSNASILNLFTSLKKEDHSLPSVKKDIMLKNIANLDQKGQEILYVLMKYYWHETGNKDYDSLPFEGKFVGKNITFDFDKLPAELKSILHKFATMHLSRMEEDKNRNELSKLI